MVNAQHEFSEANWPVKQGGLLGDFSSHLKRQNQDMVSDNSRTKTTFPVRRHNGDTELFVSGVEYCLSPVVCLHLTATVTYINMMMSSAWMVSDCHVITM